MERSLSHEQKRALLALARRTVELFITEGMKPDLSTDDPDLKDLGAAFVTLQSEGQLRGCIGQVQARIPLWDCVREMAIAAASQDPRFQKVRPNELPELDYEISVLFPMETVNDIEEITVGRDGLMLEHGYQRGLLLPQVAVEYGWDRETFLQHTAIKAGLPAHAWSEPDVTIYKFQGIIFSEANLDGPLD